MLQNHLKFLLTQKMLKFNHFHLIFLYKVLLQH
eukprot:UN01852